MKIVKLTDSAFLWFVHYLYEQLQLRPIII